MKADRTIKVAHVTPRTEAEGPGWRYALWVQGCPMRCVGCCNPGMLPFDPPVPPREATPEAVLEEVLAVAVEGLSLLGGEPFSQAEALAPLAEGARAAGRSVMVFSGYTLSELRAMTAPGVAALLAATDLLVDGRYEQSLRSSRRRWIGSDNQTLHFLSDRYSPLDPRFYEGNHVELRLRGEALEVNGWPVLGAGTGRFWGRP